MKKFKNFLEVVVTLILVVFNLSIFAVKAAQPYPEPTSLKYVNDYVGILNSSTTQYLVSVGKELEDKSGAQAVIVIISSLNNEDIESYSNGLFRQWGIGQKGKDNGLMLLLSIQDRTWRVEVGRGLEGAITDIYSARVMDQTAKPEFTAGDYDTGIKNAYSIFADTIARQYNVSLEKNLPITMESNMESGSQIRINPVYVYIFLGLVALDLILNRGRITRFIFFILFWNSLFGRRRGGGGGGGFGGFGGGTSGGGGSSGRW